MNFSQKITLLCIVLIATLSQITTDIYTPSLPAIAHFFHSTMGQAQGTMSAFLLGIAVTTLFYGPLSEGIGRKYTVLIGIALGLTGTALGLLAMNMHMLYAGRFIQGCGMGACSALWRPIFRDAFSTKDLSRLGGILVSAITASGVLAPFIGGLLQEYFHWQANFLVLLIWMSFVFLMIILLFKETSQHHGKHRLKVGFMIESYWSLIKDPFFMGFSFISFLSYGGLFAWFTAGPIIMIHGMHVSPAHFGSLLILTALSTGISGIIGGKLVNKMKQITILKLGLLIMIISGLVLLIITWLHIINIIWIMFAAIIFMFGSTFVFLNCFALGFKHVAKIAGYAGSLYACIQLLGGFVFTGVLGFINTSNPAPMAWMFVASGALSFLLYYALLHRKQ